VPVCPVTAWAGLVKPPAAPSLSGGACDATCRAAGDDAAPPRAPLLPLPLPCARPGVMPGEGRPAAGAGLAAASAAAASRAALLAAAAASWDSHRSSTAASSGLSGSSSAADAEGSSRSVRHLKSGSGPAATSADRPSVPSPPSAGHSACAQPHAATKLNKTPVQTRGS